MAVTEDTPLRKAEDINFPGYLGREETNLLKSLAILGDNTRSFYTLDRLYHALLNQHWNVKGDERVLVYLLGFVHFHLYFSMACFLRCHWAEALASLRKAIDAALVVYKIHLDPSAATRYWKWDGYEKEFLYLKKRMTEEREKDASQHAEVATLLEKHERCSGWGSHADRDSILLYRATIEKGQAEGDFTLGFGYFQVPKPADFLIQYVLLLQAHLEILGIFRLHADGVLFSCDSQWNREFSELTMSLKEKWQKLGSDFAAESPVPE